MTWRLLGEMFRVGLTAIWANKLRSFLTILGNIVAVASIVTLVSLIQGITAEITNLILSELQADEFRVTRQAPPEEISRQLRERRRRDNPRITLDDYEALERNDAGMFAAVMASDDTNGKVQFGEQVLENVQIRGVTEEFGAFPSFDVARGRLPTRTEVTRKRNVVFLGHSAGDRLFEGSEPLEKTIKIEGVHFRIVGISKPLGSMFGQSRDEFAVIPLGAYQRLFGNRNSLDVAVRPTNPDTIDRAIDNATVTLRTSRRMRPQEENNFGIFTADTGLDLYNQATTGVFAVLIGVVALALVVAGIVIMNIMLMAVSERTREIGLRKALGATQRDILWQMLSESVALSTLGGVIGTLLGTAAAALIDRLAPIPASVHIWSVLLAITLTAVVGLFFGLYPAKKAAALDPIDALGRVT